MKPTTTSPCLAAAAVLALALPASAAVGPAAEDASAILATEEGRDADAAAALAAPPSAARRRTHGKRHGRRLKRNASSIDGRDDASDAGHSISEATSATGGHARELARLPKGMRQRRQPPLQQQSATNAAPGCGPTPGTHHYPYLGCYADRASSRAFPYELHANLSRDKRLGHGALDCERECTKRGYRYFGREFRGQCFCGNDLGEATRHGREGGCDCCGGNVGAHKMCVWENANHPDSGAEPPKIPAIVPAVVNRPVPEPAIPPTHAHISSSSYSSSFSNGYSSSSNYQVSTSYVKNDVPANVPPAVSTHKPLGAFRLRLHWQSNYRWQGSSRERFWCMECRGGCREGNTVQISECDDAGRQKFIAIQKTIRPATNPSMCLTVSGYGGTSSPIKLRRCDRSRNQNFDEVKARDKFELQPEGNRGRCLSQHHHPKEREAVYPEKCEKTRRFDTTYWRVWK